MASIRKLQRAGGAIVYEVRWAAGIDPTDGRTIHRSKTCANHRAARDFVKSINEKIGRRGRMANAVYFVQGQSTQLIKIGVAKDVEARLRDLQCGSPDKLRAIGVAKTFVASEGHLHGLFAKHRAHGEWFYPHPDILAYIREHCDEVNVVDPTPKGDIETHAPWATFETINRLEVLAASLLPKVLVFMPEEIAEAFRLNVPVVLAMHKSGLLPGIVAGKDVVRFPIETTLERLRLPY